MKDLEIINLKEEKYEEWNRFCLESNSAWFRHTTWFLEYAQNCRFDGKSKNLSFIVQQNDNIMAIVPLIMQTVYDEPDIFEFAVVDTNIPFPAFANNLQHDNKKNIMRIIFEEIDRLAKKNNISYSRFFFDPLTENILQSKQKANPLPKFGYHETSLSTNIVDLSLSENELFKNMRKGHKADIKNAMKNNLVVETFFNENITEEIFRTYKELHFLAKGRKTRPEESWHNMFEFLKDGYLVLFLEKKQNNNQYIAGILVITYKKKAYYGSSAMRPEYEKVRGVGHLLQWEAMKFLKREGFRYYELGWNYYPILSQESIGKKELNISFFKSGFGGDIYPLFRGEKFYDIQFMRAKKSTLLEKYIQQYSV